MARQITDAFPWNDAPDHVIRDRDASYGHAVANRLAAMGIGDQPTAHARPDSRDTRSGALVVFSLITTSQ